jgi:diguanylate cyclase (GGDEF)-like protein
MITRDMTERRRSEDQLRRLATTDPLTGALNRRSFFEAAKAQESRWSVSLEPFALLLIDADHFKQVNDSYGHEIGDIVLQFIVREIRREIRSSDLVARYGGEEFAVMLGSTDIEGAMQIAQRICRRVGGNPFAIDELVISVTISIGVAATSSAADTFEGLMRAADGALYVAKREGRNRVVRSGRRNAEASGPRSA